MNGIRVGYPSKGSKLINCRVHMRAMGHAIFVQGAEDTLIEDCHVDGLLRPTNEILAETSGLALLTRSMMSGFSVRETRAIFMPPRANRAPRATPMPSPAPTITQVVGCS